VEYKIRKADMVEDREGIIAFWKTNFPGWQEEKYDWFYMNNPRGEADCWVAETIEDEEIVGAIACFPRRFAIDGKEHLAGLGGDLGVSKEHRQHGLAMNLRKEMMNYMGKANYAFLLGTPNDRSLRITLKAGYTILGRIRRTTRILHSKAFVKKVVPLDFISRILSGPIDFIIRTSAKENRFRNENRYKFEILDSFDSRFDDLWKRSQKNYFLMGERSADYLNWRFTQCPFTKFKTFALFEKDEGKLVSYLTYWVEGSIVEIGDFYGGKMPDCLDPLISSFLLYMRGEPVDRVILTHFGNTQYQQKFRDFGFKMRPDQRAIILFADQSSSYYDRIFEQSNWHFSAGDNDVQ